jgi:hypothetical protein
LAIPQEAILFATAVCLDAKAFYVISGPLAPRHVRQNSMQGGADVFKPHSGQTRLCHWRGSRLL